MKSANNEVTKSDIERGFTEGRSESMIQEEKERNNWACPIRKNEDESLDSGFLGRRRTWER